MDHEAIGRALKRGEVVTSPLLGAGKFGDREMVIVPIRSRYSGRIIRYAVNLKNPMRRGVGGR